VHLAIQGDTIVGLLFVVVFLNIIGGREEGGFEIGINTKVLVGLCGKHSFRVISEKDSPTFVSSRGSRRTVEIT
jgi:hypothetical protein